MLPISLKFFIIMTISVSATLQCNGQERQPMHSNNQHNQFSNTDHLPNRHGFHEVDCLVDLVDKSYSSSECNPRIQDVQLIPPPEWRYEPDIVAVKRCYGKCPSRTTCLPKDKSVTKFVVEAIHDGPEKAKCASIEVEEHHKCGCDCAGEIEKQCNTKQKYLKGQCECVCKDADKNKYECESTIIEDMSSEMYGQKIMKWDPKSCTCGCTNKLMSLDKMCTTGRVWDSKNCKCIKANDQRDPDLIDNAIFYDESSYD